MTAATALVKQWKADHTLLPDTKSGNGWWCVKESELLEELAAALDAVRRETWEQAAKHLEAQMLHYEGEEITLTMRVFITNQAAACRAQAAARGGGT